jgi:hypothetical protein
MTIPFKQIENEQDDIDDFYATFEKPLEPKHIEDKNNLTKGRDSDNE